MTEYSPKQQEELEVKLAFLEDALAKLGDEFYLQQKELNTLKSNFSLLQEKLQSRGDESQGADTVLDERPPHY